MSVGTNPKKKFPAWLRIRKEDFQYGLKCLHSTWQAQTYPQAIKQNRLDTCVLRLCNAQLYDLPRIYHETNLPTVSNQKKTYPWIFGSNENTWGTRGHQGAPRQRPCKTCCLIFRLSRQNLQPRIGCCAKTVLTKLFMLKIFWMNVSRYFSSKTVRILPDLE